MSGGAGRLYTKANGKTREINIANLQRIDGHEGDIFDIGYMATIIGFRKTFTDRIITYKKCLDDPRKDSIVLGTFINDFTTDVIKLEVEVHNSVQRGEVYNGVDISHRYGFKSTSGSGTTRIYSNGTDGFVAEQYYGGKWVKVWQIEPLTGKSVSYNLAHTQKVETGGYYGLTTWLRMGSNPDGTPIWEQTGGMDANGNLLATKLAMVESPNYYAIIGQGPNPGDGYGLGVVDAYRFGPTPFFSVWLSADGTTILQSKSSSGMMFADANGNSIGIDGTYNFRNCQYTYKGGLLTDFTDGGVIPSATITDTNGVRYVFTHGVLTDIIGP